MTCSWGSQVDVVCHGGRVWVECKALAPLTEHNSTATALLRQVGSPLHSRTVAHEFTATVGVHSVQVDQLVKRAAQHPCAWVVPRVVVRFSSFVAPSIVEALRSHGAHAWTCDEATLSGECHTPARDACTPV